MFFPTPPPSLRQSETSFLGEGSWEALLLRLRPQFPILINISLITRINMLEIKHGLVPNVNLISNLVFFVNLSALAGKGGHYQF